MFYFYFILLPGHLLSLHPSSIRASPGHCESATLSPPLGKTHSLSLDWYLTLRQQFEMQVKKCFQEGQKIYISLKLWEVTECHNPFLVPPTSPTGHAACGPLRPFCPHRAQIVRARFRLLRVAVALQTGSKGIALSENDK